MSLGAFVGGFQSGLRTTQDARQRRQIEKLNEFDLEELQAKADYRDRDRAARNLPPIERKKSSDPFFLKMGDWFSSKFGSKAAQTPAIPEQAVIAPAAPAEAPMGALPSPEEYGGAPDDQLSGGFMGFADGKPPMTEEEMQRQRAERYGVTGERLVANVGTASDKLAKLGPRAARGALNFAADQLERGTDDPIDNPAEKAFDSGRVLAASALRGRARTPTLVEGARSAADSGSEPAPAAPTRPRVAAGGAGGPRRGRAAAIPAPAAAPATAPASAASPVAAEEPGADPFAGVNWAEVAPTEVPRFATADWVKHREELIDNMVDSGMPLHDAYARADQQVMKTQMDGFRGFLTKSSAALAMGDLNAAASLVSVAFQYLPTRSDIRTAVVDGKLKAVFIDEQTGQPTGPPVTITPELLGTIGKEMLTPGTWASVAEDRAKTEAEDKLKNRELTWREERTRNVEVPQAEASLLGASAQVMGALGRSGAGEKEITPMDQQKAADQANSRAWELGAQLGLDESDVGVLSATAQAAYIEGRGQQSIDQIFVRIDQAVRAGGKGAVDAFRQGLTQGGQ
jgi:hypothetical protein